MLATKDVLRKALINVVPDAIAVIVNDKVALLHVQVLIYVRQMPGKGEFELIYNTVKQTRPANCTFDIECKLYDFKKANQQL